MVQPTDVRTYPPAGECGVWLAALRIALGHLDAPIRPYCYVGRGATEQAAIDHLMTLEAADTWSTDNVKFPDTIPANVRGRADNTSAAADVSMP